MKERHKALDNYRLFVDQYPALKERATSLYSLYIKNRGEITDKEAYDSFMKGLSVLSRKETQ